MKKADYRDLPGGPVAMTLRFQCRGPEFYPGQGTGSHMLQLKVPHVTTKTQRSQIKF